MTGDPEDIRPQLIKRYEPPLGGGTFHGDSVIWPCMKASLRDTHNVLYGGFEVR